MAYGNHGPAKAKKAPQGLEGITYKVSEELGAAGTRKRRKATLEDLYGTRDACERSQAASDAIRARARVWIVPVDGRPHGSGLPALEPNFYRVALARKIAELESGPAPRKRSTSPKVDVRPAGSLAGIAGAVRARERAECEIREAVAAARANGVSVAACARQLGMTRQGLYKYLAR